MSRSTASARPRNDPIAWHLLLIVCVSAGYESLFVHHGIGWLFDEGWPLYAAMRLHAGGILYRDVSFIFPPGHLLCAWVAAALDPPGIILARVFYAVFNVALCVAMYLLARRLMRAPYALLAVLLLAVAAPRSHLSHLLFGYRYLVFAILVLLAFARRLGLEAGDTRRAFFWMMAAGIGAGVAVCFRLTPAFAVSCAVTVGVLAHSADWRAWLRDWTAYGLGLALVLASALIWFASGVGLETLWREIVVRAVVMTERQSLPILPLTLLPASGGRGDVFRWFIALQYRAYGILFAGYILGLSVRLVHARRARIPFERTLLLSTAIWGGVYLLRSLGRSDDHHLMSELPPACLLLAHGLDQIARRVGARADASRRTKRVFATLTALAVLGVWGYAQRVDLFLTSRYRGEVPIASTGGAVRVTSRKTARRIDRVVEVIRRTTRVGDVILDLTGAPLFYPLTGRLGPGFLDVVSPGSFMSAAEERAFVERLADQPPAAVLWPRDDFDDMEQRSLSASAPLVSAWVRRKYREHRVIDRYAVLLPRRPPVDPR